MTPEFNTLRALLQQPTTDGFWKAALPLMEERSLVPPSEWDEELRELVRQALLRDAEQCAAVK